MATANTTSGLLTKTAVGLLVAAGLALGWPLAIGYLYAWTWVLPYTSVCKPSLLSSDFTAEEYHIFLLNHGCNVDEEIRRYVRDFYASLNKDAADDVFDQLFTGLKPAPTPPAMVNTMAERALLIFHGKAQPQNAAEVGLVDAVRFDLNQFRSFHFPAPDCGPTEYCAVRYTTSHDIISQPLEWVVIKYGSYVGSLLLESVDQSASQVAAVWEQGSLVRAGLLIVYALATSLLATGIFEFAKWRLKN